MVKRPSIAAALMRRTLTIPGLAAAPVATPPKAKAAPKAKPAPAKKVPTAKVAKPAKAAKPIAPKKAVAATKAPKGAKTAKAAAPVAGPARKQLKALSAQLKKTSSLLLKHSK